MVWNEAWEFLNFAKMITLATFTVPFFFLYLLSGLLPTVPLFLSLPSQCYVARDDSDDR